MSVIDLTGLRYGKLTVVEFAGQDSHLSGVVTRKVL